MPSACESFSSSGRALSNVTLPGPRYFDQRTLAGARCAEGGALVPLVYFMSSLSQSGSAGGGPTVAVRAGAFATVAIGPWVVLPVSSKRITGGVLPTAISVKGDITESAFSRPGMLVVGPFAVIVHT